jgi:transporter family-2 protein
LAVGLITGIAVALGGAVAAQAQLNGVLTQRTGSPIMVALISFAVGTAILGLITIVRREGPSLAELRRLQWRRWWLFNGPLGAFLIVAVSAAVPLLGVARVTVLTVAGQTIAGIVLDARGTGVGGRLRVSFRRAAAVAVALVGLAVMVLASPMSSPANAPTLGVTMLLLLAAGAASGLQQAVNGAITGASGRPVFAALTSFTGGLVVLAAIVGLQWAIGTLKVTDLPTAGGDWWLYTGGIFGALFVVNAAWVVRRIGVVALSLAVVAGQIVAAVLLDLFVGSANVTIVTVISIAAVFIAVILAAVRPTA